MWSLRLPHPRILWCHATQASSICHPVPEAPGFVCDCGPSPSPSPLPGLVISSEHSHRSPILRKTAATSSWARHISKQANTIYAKLRQAPNLSLHAEVSMETAPTRLYAIWLSTASPIWSSNSTSVYIPKILKVGSCRGMCTPMVIAALFTIVKK